MRLIPAVTHPFKDRQWPGKLGMAVLVSAIPFFGFFIIKGWEFEISVRVRHHSILTLPGWGNLGSKFLRGLLIRLAGLIYNLPTFLMLGFSLLLWIELFIGLFNLETLTLSALADLWRGRLVMRLALLAATGLYALAANIMYWAGYLRYIETRRFGAFFEIIQNVRLVFLNVFDDLLNAVYIAIVSAVAWAVGALLTALLSATGVGAFLVPFLVPALSLTFMSTVKGHLFGQLTTRTLDRLQGRSPLS